MAKWSARTRCALFFGSLAMVATAALAGGEGNIKAIAVETNGEVLLYCKFPAFDDLKTLVSGLDTAQLQAPSAGAERYRYTLRLLGPGIDARRFVSQGVYSDGETSRHISDSQYETLSQLVLPRLRHSGAKLADVKSVEQVTPSHWSGC